MSAIIPQRHAGVLLSALMALSMSTPISAIMFAVNGGVALGWDAFLVPWARASATGFLVAFPIASFVLPRIRALTDRLTGQDDN